MLRTNKLFLRLGFIGVLSAGIYNGISYIIHSRDQGSKISEIVALIESNNLDQAKTTIDNYVVQQKLDEKTRQNVLKAYNDKKVFEQLKEFNNLLVNNQFFDAEDFIAKNFLTGELYSEDFRNKRFNDIKAKKQDVVKTDLLNLIQEGSIEQAQNSLKEKKALNELSDKYVSEIEQFIKIKGDEFVVDKMRKNYFKEFSTSMSSKSYDEIVKMISLGKEKGYLTDTAEKVELRNAEKFKLESIVKRLADLKDYEAKIPELESLVRRYPDCELIKTEWPFVSENFFNDIYSLIQSAQPLQITVNEFSRYVSFLEISKPVCKENDERFQKLIDSSKQYASDIRVQVIIDGSRKDFHIGDSVRLVNAMGPLKDGIQMYYDEAAGINEVPLGSVGRVIDTNMFDNKSSFNNGTRDVSYKLKIISFDKEFWALPNELVLVNNSDLLKKFYELINKLENIK